MIKYLKQLIKEFIKRLPGIRRVVEGRDRFIRLYYEQLEKNEMLAAQTELLSTQCKIERQKTDDLNSRLCAESAAHEQERGEWRKKLDSTNTLLEEKQLELDEKNAVLERFQYKENSDAIVSGNFWNDIYASGGTSGSGSYGRLADFKARIVNQFLLEHQIDSVIEIGCGDGNQLSLIQYHSYTGVDVSPIIVQRNREKFADKEHYSFWCTKTDRNSYADRKYDMALSMDVIFHLLEDDVFHSYLDDLFTLASKYVVIYSSNHEEYTCWPEYRHRNFTGYVKLHFPEWELFQYIPNDYPYMIGQETETSASDFYFFRKKP